jgi:hypothetical protein
MKMHTARRILVNFDLLNLPIDHDQILSILQKLGFAFLEVDLIGLARSCMGYATFMRGARIGQAPQVIDCSSFVKWLYAQKGYWLPRLAIQQRGYGIHVEYPDISSGDLVFVSGYRDRYETDPADGVGHVGIATGEKTVIHAGDRTTGVVECTLEMFAPTNLFRGVRRYIPQSARTATLGIPSRYDVETEDDVRWMILQSLT